MAFDSLSEKLQNVFKNLRSKGRLTEDDVKAALKEVKMALLEADVNFKVVKQFVKDVQERAIGQDVMNGLNPGQMVIKIVNEEMVRLMGSETTEIALRPGKELTIIMMAGLQGAGKTTTTAKIAGKLKAKGKKVLLAACDVYRPAAIEQLQINGEKQGVDAVKQRLFLHRTHVRFFQCLDVKADHIAWMLGKQGGKIVLRFRLIDDIRDAETQL
mgnify:CR=1 FL=1